MKAKISININLNTIKTITWYIRNFNKLTLSYFLIVSCLLIYLLFNNLNLYPLKYILIEKHLPHSKMWLKNKNFQLLSQSSKLHRNQREIKNHKRRITLNLWIYKTIRLLTNYTSQFTAKSKQFKKYSF